MEGSYGSCHTHAEFLQRLLRLCDFAQWPCYGQPAKTLGEKLKKKSFYNSFGTNKISRRTNNISRGFFLSFTALLGLPFRPPITSVLRRVPRNVESRGWLRRFGNRAHGYFH